MRILQIPFFNADTLVLADIYAAREKDTGIVNSDILGDKIREKGVNCKNLHSFEDITKFLRQELKEGDPTNYSRCRRYL